MTLRFWPVVWALCLSLLAQARGQEVRRALPIAPTPAPAPRALPVNPSELPPPSGDSILDQGIKQPFLTPKPAPTPQKPAEPASTSSGSSAEPDPKTRDQVTDDEIRLAPSSGAQSQNPENPAKAQLAVADGLYLRKLYDLAVPEYEKYLGQYHDDSDRASAMYRLADCYQSLGQEAPALNTYRMLINEIGTGEFVGSAAFRLASREFDRKAYWDAAPLYEKAYANAKAPEVKLTARYYEAKCLEIANKRADAQPLYEEVFKTKEKNPYRDAAGLSLAYYSLENNQKQQALDRFQELGRDAVKPAVKAEAMTRAGILAGELKQREQAEQLFKTVIGLGSEGKWKQIAWLELMKLEYEGDKFTQVLDSYSRTMNTLSSETKPSVLMIVANSYRQIGKQQKALDVYNQLINQFPASPEASDARFQRLVSLDATKDPNLIPEIDAFLGTYPSRDRADKAKLLKAQALFQQSKFDPAGKLYLELADSSLPDSYKAECYYAAGYSLSQVNNTQGAINAFGGLIDKYPHYKMASKALLKRAVLYQEIKNYPAALSDFSRIISDYGPSAERETALLQKGLTLGQQENFPEMTAAFNLLLKEYPNSAGAAQANYWIGWAAFESKKYVDAIASLQEARKRNPQEYEEKVSLRLIFSYQTLGRKTEEAKEIDDFLQKDPNRFPLVSDSCLQLGTGFYDEKNYAPAAKYLELITKNLERGKIDKGVWFLLGKSETELKRYTDAVGSLNNYLEQATEPGDRARAFLAISQAQLGAQQFDAARQSADQALTLQPEGRLNADARMLLGDVDSAQGNYANAAKSYLSVALLYEDPEVTPRALEQAYQAFRHSGDESQATKTLSELKSRFPNYQLKQPAAG